MGNKVEGPLGGKGGQWYPRAGFTITRIARFQSRGAVCEVMKGRAAPEAQVIELPELHTLLFFLGREGGSLLIQFHGCACVVGGRPSRWNRLMNHIEDRPAI